MIIMLVAGTIGIALKFTTFFDRWVYFPSFPNIFDAAFLILSVGYLTWLAKKSRTAKQTVSFSIAEFTRESEELLNETA
jgi:hypothetical protein